MNPAARQLCRASQRSCSPDDVKLGKCPVCSREVTPTEWVKHTVEGVTERWPVIPAHARDEQGEIRVNLAKVKSRAPGSGNWGA